MPGKPDPRPAARIVDPKAIAAKVALEEGRCRACGMTGELHGHHLVTRGQRGGDVAANIVALCKDCHAGYHNGSPDVGMWIRRNLTRPEISYILEKKGRSYLDKHYPWELGPGSRERSLSLRSGSDQDSERVGRHPASEDSAYVASPSARSDGSHVPPGSTCPTCDRRVPHPKKPTSPSSKTVSFRMPVEVVADYKALVDAAAEHAGIAERPFAQFGVVNAALALFLRDAPKDCLADEAAASTA